jgi:hypothetical protein
MTPKERKIFLEGWRSRRRSRITNFTSGHTEQQLGDGSAYVGQVIPGSIDGSWEPVDEKGNVPGQSGSDPNNESGTDVPEGQRKDSDDEIEKAQVNRSADGTTRGPVHVNTNDSEPITITSDQFAKLSASDRVVICNFQRKHPNVIMILDAEGKEVFIAPSFQPLGVPDILELQK